MRLIALAIPLAALVAGSAFAQAPTPAASSSAQTSQRERMKDCSSQAKSQGLKGADRKTFLSSCLTTNAAAPSAPASTTPAPSATTTRNPASSSPAPARKTSTAPSAPSTGSSVPAGSAVFPPAVSAKYSSESAGKARMHTCLDQYNVNKAANANGGLNWIAKGGGYYSECNKRLKS